MRADESSRAPLSLYYKALVARGMSSKEVATFEQFRTAVEEASNAYLEERYDFAALTLFELLESPRYAPYTDAEEAREAEYILAGALHREAAVEPAMSVLERLLSHGPATPYFAPAVRRFSDVALASGSLPAAIRRLEAAVAKPLSRDTADELAYLRGRERYDARDFASADQQLSQVSKASRFFANAMYLRGASAARAKNYKRAEAYFCAIAKPSDVAKHTFRIDSRYFEVKDLARLGLGRVAHEMRRSNDAFYYYFQVPSDSDRLSEAMFEAAYAMYEGGDYDNAVDLLDQLEARFPTSPFVDEATLLRGYVHLARCDFERAQVQFQHFTKHFSPVLAEVQRLVDDASRRGALYESILADEEAPENASRNATVPLERARPRSILLALLVVDPDFFRLHSSIRSLDAEAARSGHIANDLNAIAQRLRNPHAPLPVTGPDEPLELARMHRDLEAARLTLGTLTDQLDGLRRAGASRSQVQETELKVRELGNRMESLERRLSFATKEVSDVDVNPAQSDALEALLERDRRAANRLPARVASLRGKLVLKANDAAFAAVVELRKRLGAGLRRARIGRIDAVMGSKRRVEIQIQSLAAGRFPAELQDPLRVQGLLRDDEEYWPYEGEYWPDEYIQDPVLDSEGEE